MKFRSFLRLLTCRRSQAVSDDEYTICEKKCRYSRVDMAVTITNNTAVSDGIPSPAPSKDFTVTLKQRSTLPKAESRGEYARPVESIRREEYPNMSNGAYLDHSGATIYAKSLVTDFSHAMTTNLWGNPHSENSPARSSGDMVDDVRLRTLRFLGADPEHFDLVFVANATAAIKLVADAFHAMGERTASGGFWYGCHSEAHTSLLGIRELSGGRYHCFRSDEEVDSWLRDPALRDPALRGSSSGAFQPCKLGLFAYPGQSNLNGRRLPKDWTRKVRRHPHLRNTYTLFDAAALAMTSSLSSVFEDPEAAPDFTCVSFYKIFGFPDLGGLVVRKSSGHVLSLRKYFGGGTIAQVSAFEGVSTVVKKASGMESGVDGHEWSIHDGLEDGTLPFHSILALGIAIETHLRLYGSMDAISRHCTRLGSILYQKLIGLQHTNGAPLLEIYATSNTQRLSSHPVIDPELQGATFAFNVMNPSGVYVPWTTVESVANGANVYIRAGGVCCPGGVAKALQYEEWEWDRMFSHGHACGRHETAIVHKKPTGIVRASLGPMSTLQDIEALVVFLRDTFVE